MEDHNTDIEDFKQNRSDILIEIKGEIILLNESLSSAETDYRFLQSEKPVTRRLYASVYYHLTEVFKLTLEMLPNELSKEIGTWLSNFQYERSQQGVFLSQASRYSKEIQSYLYDIGIKDTNIRKPVAFPWDRYIGD